MALILCIETSQQKASLALTCDGVVISFRASTGQKEHGSFIQPSIKEMMDEAGKSLAELDAVSVCAGPGSYTGLRVGMASAKGICYALQKPLISISSLMIIAHVAQQIIRETYRQDDYLIVPMIDARRNEVFTSVMDNHLTMKIPPQAMILAPHSFSEYNGKTVFFTGDGSDKWKNQCLVPNAIFHPVQWDAACMSVLSDNYFNIQLFESVEKAIPLYGKSFYSGQSSG